MKKLTRKIAALLTASTIALAAVTLPDTEGLLPGLAVSASAADASSVFGALSGGLYTLESGDYELSEDIITSGRIYVPGGVQATIDLNGHTIDRGLSSFADGGSVFGVAEGAQLTVSNGTVKGGARSGGNGGGFNVNGELILNSVIVEDCKAEHAGGGIYISGANASVLMKGNTIVRNNTAGTYGGGIYVGQDAKLSMENEPVVKGNAGSNVYLTEGRKINLSNSLVSGAEVGVTQTDKGTGSFTKDYGTYSTADPSGFFFGDNGDKAVLVDSEASLALPYIKRSWNSTTNTVEEETLYIGKYIPFDKVRVSGDNTVDLTDDQWYVLTEDTVLSHKVRVFVGANILLCDGKKLTCQKGIVVENNNTLSIYTQKNDTGRLVSTGVTKSAGIGSDNDNDDDTVGTIRIYGGNITATGENYAACIGGGFKTGGGTIEIYGGTVTAVSDKESGIGIGGGYSESADYVRIYGGKVTAKGGDFGAGIGSGYNADDIGNIGIFGGTVYATGTEFGAAIGGTGAATFKSQNEGTVTIAGGYVEARSCHGSACIGSGAKRSCEMDITITGGTVVVSHDTDSDTGGAGIGGGYKGTFRGTIKITGGTVRAEGGKAGDSEGGASIGAGFGGDMDGTITVTGGDITAVGVCGAAAIGAGSKDFWNQGGECNGTISILGGTVRLKNDTTAKAPGVYLGRGYGRDSKYDGTLILGDEMKVRLMDPGDKTGKDALVSDRISTCRLEHTSYDALYITPCDHPGAAYEPDPKNDKVHIKHCKYCKHSETEPHKPDSTGKCTLCGYSLEFTKVDRVEPTCTEQGNAEYYTDKYGNYYMEDPAKPGSIINVTARMTDLPELGHDLVSEITDKTEATCENAGHYTVKETCTRCDYLKETVVNVPALGHDYAPVTYAWNNDYTECKAKKVCRNDETHTITENATITSEVTKAATVSEPGERTYTATFTTPGFTTLTAVVTTAKLIPEYNEPTYEWAADYSWCKGVRTSVNAASDITETTNNIQISETVPATCAAEGKTTYTATFADPAFTTQTKTVPIPKLTTHEPGKTVTEVAAAATCTESGIEYDTVYCKVCDTLISRTMRSVAPLGHKRGEPVEENVTAATCTTDGSYDEVVTCTVCNTEISRKTIVVKAFGHDWCEPTYTWAADNSTVTAKRVCAHDSTHTETETVNTNESVITEATAEKNGLKVYTATFENTAFTEQQKKVDIPASGYDQLTFGLEYGSAVYDGTEKRPEVTVKDENGQTLAASEYIVTYSENINVGTATVKIEDNHGGDHVFETVSLNFTITKADAVITAGKSSYSKTYGDPDFIIDSVSASFNAPVVFTLKSGADVISLNGRTVSLLRTGNAVITASVAATDNYGAASTDISVTVAKANSPAGKSEITLNVDNSVVKVGDINAPADWTWSEPEKELPVGETVTTTAVYSGADAECYENTTITAKITRANHTHTKGAATRRNVVEATCTEGGSYDEVILCARCGAVLSSVHTATDPLDHLWGEAAYSWSPDNITCTASMICERNHSHTKTETVGTTCVVLRQPTETENGAMLYTAVFGNSAFDKQTKTADIPSFTHVHKPGKKTIQNKVKATCTTGGSYDEVVRCTECGGVISRTTYTTGALGHEYVNGVCTRCGETKQDYGKPEYTVPEYVPPVSTDTGSTGTAIRSYHLDIIVSNNITNKEYVAKIDITEDIINTLAKLPEDGDTKKAQTITLGLGRENAGRYANLYHRDSSTGKLRFAGSRVIGGDGSAKLKFAYPPEYTIMIDDHSHGITAEPTATGVRLAWEPVENAESYTVYVRKNGKLKKLTTTSKTSVNITGLKNGTTYEFTVRYKVAGKLSEIADSYTISFNAAYKPVVSAQSGNGSVTLKWKAVGGAEKYKVCRYVDGKLKALSEVTGTAVKITGTKSGKTYTYAVKALINGKWTKVYSGDLVSVTAK